MGAKPPPYNLNSWNTYPKTHIVGFVAVEHVVCPLPAALKVVDVSRVWIAQTRRTVAVTSKPIIAKIAAAFVVHLYIQTAIAVHGI